MASSNAIGSGSVVLTANADQLTAGLDQAAAKVDSFGKKAQASADRLTKGRLGGLGSEGAAKLMEAARAIIPATFTAIATGAAKAVAAGVAQIEKFNAALERTKELSEKTTAAFASTLTAALDGPDGPGKLGDIRDALRRAEADRIGLDTALNKQRRLASGEGLSKFFGADTLSVVKDIPLLGSGVAAQMDMAKASAADLAAKSAAAAEAVKKLRDALRQPTEVEAFTKAMQEQAATVGLSAEQVKLRELEMKGATATELEAARAEAKWLEVTKKNFETAKAVDDLTKSLREQAETFGMTAEQAAIYKLEQQGATEQQLRAARHLEVMNRMRNHAAELAEKVNTPFDFSGPKLAGALEAGSAEAFRAVVRHQMSGVAETTGTGKSLLDATRDGNKIARDTLDAVKGLALGAV